MPDPPYEVGDLARLTAAFHDPTTGSPISPSSVMVRVLNPLGSTATYAYGGASTPTALASGSFQLDYPVDLLGQHHVRWQATGPRSAEEFSFNTVATSRF
jgi:hypothetical protein